MDLGELLPLMEASVNLANSPKHDHMHHSLSLFPRSLVHNGPNILAETFYGWVDILVKKILIGFILLMHKLVLHLCPTGNHNELFDIFIVE